MENPFSLCSLVLRALEEGPGCGSDITERLARLSNGTIVPSPGALYPAIKLAHSKGWIKTFEGKKLDTDRRREPFILTNAGQVRVSELRAHVIHVWCKLPSPKE